jgi:hypothetical protein
MKTIKKNDKYLRVSDEEAFDKVEKGWEFCPKSEWKVSIRDVKRDFTPKKEPVSKKKTSKKNVVKKQANS